MKKSPEKAYVEISWVIMMLKELTGKELSRFKANNFLKDNRIRPSKRNKHFKWNYSKVIEAIKKNGHNI